MTTIVVLDGMTVGLGINCTDGIVLACDSMATFGRGVPVVRYTNKIHIVDHPQLEHKVAAIAAGITLYWDKFRERATRHSIDAVASHLGRRLDIVDFCEGVCEPIVTALLKEYAIDRAKFLGAPIVEFSLSMLVAGATKDGEIRAYFVHPEGVTEPLEHFGTIGSGAAYAELFLRYLLAESQIDTTRASRLACYAVKGVELMDPNVGGEANVATVKMGKGRLKIEIVPPDKHPDNPRDKMEHVLKRISQQIEALVVKPDAGVADQEEDTGGEP